MGKKYYCDYCQKHIQQDPAIVRKHNEGIPHLRNRADHYEQCKDATEILTDNMGKKLCRTMIISEECTFGASCRYSHLNPNQLKRLQQKVARLNCQRTKRLADTIEKLNSAEIITQQFLTRRAEKIAKEAVESKQFWTCEVENQLFLPPSLHKIDPFQIDSTSFAEWG